MTTRHHASITDRLDRLSMPEPNTGCVLWLGYLDSGGYGRFTVNPQAQGRLAHVVAYELFVGPVPTDLELDHLCRNRACIAYWHLEAVTHRANLLRGKTLAARNAAKVVCSNGHAFDTVNTYTDRHGWRGCRTCRREADRRASAARRVS